MRKILIVYSTKEGQTYKIAKFIGDELQTQGFSVYLIDAKNIGTENHIRSYDGIIVGAPIHMGQYPKILQKWVRSNAYSISQRPNAFYSVCLGILEKNSAETQSDVRKIATDFFEWSGWQPAKWTTFAGAVMYSKYNWFTRLIMKNKSKKAGGDTDTSRDYEYTDWNDVREFAKQFGEFVVSSELKFERELKFDDFQIRIGATNL